MKSLLATLLFSLSVFGAYPSNPPPEWVTQKALIPNGLGKVLCWNQTMATGGTITNIPGYRVHTFMTSGTFTVTKGGNMDVLIVAGGGGGGVGYGSGGGGGGVIATSIVLAAGTYAITNGLGGRSGTGANTIGSPGTNSSAFGLVAIGGGYGVNQNKQAGSGGSGGGGSSSATLYLGGAGTIGQGYAGGTGYIGTAASGGGGGAGRVGGSVSGTLGGKGGAGYASTISGVLTYYGGGGCGVGSGGSMTVPYVGGVAKNASGTNGLGQGAGGDNASANGGSGVVIVRYPNNGFTLVNTPLTISIPSMYEAQVTVLAGATHSFTVVNATNLWIQWGDGCISNANGSISLGHAYTTAGTYTIQISGYATNIIWGTDAPSRSNLVSMVTPFQGVSRISSLSNAFLSNVNLNYQPANLLAGGHLATGVKDLYQTWYGCSRMTNFPAVSNLTGVTKLYATWALCSSMSNAPEVNNLVNNSSLYRTWMLCRNASSFPAVSNMLKVSGSLDGCWYECRSATNFPYINSLTGITDLVQTWYFATNCLMFPDVSNLTKVTSLYMSWRDCRLAKSFPYVNSLTNVTALAGANGGAWMSCSSATGFPEVSALIKNTTLLYTWQGCTSVVDAFPNVSTLTNVTDMRHTWSGNTGYTGDIAVIFANTNAGMPFLTTSSNAFANCRSMTGNGMRFVNMSKSATYWANTGGPAFVSCAKTFYNCTNLSDYATIPLEYK